jgi:hypothetical protein
METNRTRPRCATIGTDTHDSKHTNPVTTTGHGVRAMSRAGRFTASQPEDAADGVAGRIEGANGVNLVAHGG